MNLTGRSVSSAAMMAGLFAALPVCADSGTVEILTSAQTNDIGIPMGDTTVTARSGNGTITFIRSGGAPFVEGTSGRIQFATFSKKSSAGMDLESDGLATFSSGDTLQLLFKRKTGDLAAGTSAEGILYLPGGTGRFAGINGECRYTVENLAGSWIVTIARCSWKN